MATRSALKHLEKVFLSVFLFLLTYTIGLHIGQYFINSIVRYTLFVIGIILTIWFTIDTIKNKNAYGNGKLKKERICSIFFICIIIGIKSGSLISYTLKIEPHKLVEAGLGTCLLFSAFVTYSIKNLCFETYINSYVNPLSYIYNIGMISTFIVSLWLMIVNYFLNWTYIQQLIHGVSIITVCLKITNETHKIVESFDKGDRDFLSHSLTLSLSCVKLFEKILTIQTYKQKRSEKQLRS